MQHSRGIPREPDEGGDDEKGNQQLAIHGFLLQCELSRHGIRRRCLPWCQPGPEHFEGVFNSGEQSGIAVERPDQERSKNGLPENIGKNLGWQIIANFSALLAEADYFRVDGYDARLQIHHGFADRRVGKKRLQKNSDDRGIANRLLRHTRAERTQENPRGFILCARFIGSGTQLSKLHFGKGQEDVFFSGGIIEESALAEIGGVGYVFDGSFRKAFSREEIECGAEEARRSRQGMRTATSWRDGRLGGRHERTVRINDYRSY